MRALMFFVAVLVGWASAYSTGTLPWLGYASLTRSSFGAGGVTIIGENRRGLDFGLDSFLFFRGQEIFIDYDASITTGALWFHVFQPFDGNLGDGTSVYVTESGKGSWTMPVEKTAIYHITIEPTPTRGAGRGWDLTYDVSWGGRTPARQAAAPGH